MAEAEDIIVDDGESAVTSVLNLNEGVGGKNEGCGAQSEVEKLRVGVHLAGHESPDCYHQGYDTANYREDHACLRRINIWKRGSWWDHTHARLVDLGLNRWWRCSGCDISESRASGC